MSKDIGDLLQFVREDPEQATKLIVHAYASDELERACELIQDMLQLLGWLMAVDREAVALREKCVQNASDFLKAAGRRDAIES